MIALVWGACAAPPDALELVESDTPPETDRPWDQPPPIWEVAMPNMLAQATCPVLLDGDIVGAASYGVGRFSRADGAVLWWEPLLAYQSFWQVTQSLAVVGDRIVVANMDGYLLVYDGDGTQSARVRDTGNGGMYVGLGECDGRLYYEHISDRDPYTGTYRYDVIEAIDASTLATVWEYPLAFSSYAYVTGMSACGDPLLFAVADSGEPLFDLLAVDVVGRQEVWSIRADVYGRSTERLSADGGLLATGAHDLVVLNRFTGGEVWRAEASIEASEATLGATDTRLIQVEILPDRWYGETLVQGATAVQAFDWQSGALLWRIDGPDVVALGWGGGTLAPDGRTMYFMHSDGYFAIDTEAGSLLAVYRVGPVAFYELQQAWCPPILTDVGVLVYAPYGMAMLPYLPGLGPEGQSPP